MRGRALLLVAAYAALLVPIAEGASGPRLMLLDRSPVVIAGVGFKAGERVRVTVRAPSLVVERDVRADPSGRFRTAIPRLSLTGALRCATGVTIVARPRAGGLHLWRAPRLPNCASPPLEPA